jgi:predicted 3-demethylubiquinone-9 3-methyltransferase (glyoxalase superfamily)
MLKSAFPLEGTEHDEEHDLPLVREGCRSRSPLLCEDLSRSAVHTVHRAPSDYPSGKEGDVLTVDFTVAGIPCIGLNGGPVFKHNEAFSFQIATDDQEETDRYWNAIVGNGGAESACGWCKDKWGISWQITPRVLTEAMAIGGAQAKRAFEVMMTMKKIDVAAIEAARRG